VEVCQTVFPLDILDAKLNLLEGLILIVVQICQVYLADPALLLLRGNLGALRLGDEGLTAAAHGEATGCLDVIPLLLQEGVSLLLLTALPTALCQALVLANSHS